MTLTVTTLYALPLIAIWLTLWMRVSQARAALNLSFGDGGQMDLLRRIRQHGNFIEWVPFTLLLMILAEAQGTAALWLHGAGALLLIGRVAHPFGLVPDSASHPLRYVGNGTNVLAALLLAVVLFRTLTGL